MKPKPYRARSLAGAERRVRELLQQRAKMTAEWEYEREMLAMLAADGPCYDSPMVAMAAKELRDRILAGMGRNPDGTWIAKE